MNTAYRCPLCQEALELTGKSYICSNGHCFDIAKENYVNLLPVQNKKSKDPGDNALMIQARQRFLQNGYYQRFCDVLMQTLKTHAGKAEYILDVGCGNGWYTEQVQTHFKAAEIHGIDISKHAVRASAKSAKAARNLHPNNRHKYAVASAYTLPYFENSFDAAFCIFSPAAPDEIERVLKSGGAFILAGPGPSHLKELAALIYDEAKPHQGNDFTIEECEQLEELTPVEHREKIMVTQGQLGDLLAMTPYYWSTSEAKKNEITSLKQLELTLDFQIRCFLKSA